MSELDFEGWTCPVPLRDHPNVVIAHGGGGQMSAEMVEHLFLPHFADEKLNALNDQAVVEIGGMRIAFTTDSFTVSPIFFPGGDIGDLAVNGTVNDLAVCGATPLYLSAGFILEEGFPLAALDRVAASMARACRAAGVRLVTADTKVVERGHGDGVYVNTSGMGIVPGGMEIGADRAEPGDAIIVSGEIGLHGIAIMSQREGLDFESVVESDSAPLNGLVSAMLEATRNIHAMRDPTRGGLASALNEIARASNVGMEIDERAVPVPPPVRAACEMLGLDPYYVANEGKLVAILPAALADGVLERMRSHPFGRDAAIIGRVVEEHPRIVLARTGIGGSRVVDMLVGEQLPRIC